MCEYQPMLDESAGTWGATCTTHDAAWPCPADTTPPYVLALHVGDDPYCHALPAVAPDTYWQPPAETGYAMPLCGGPLVRIPSIPIPFAHDAAPPWAKLCPTCCWTAATATATATADLDVEIRAWELSGPTGSALARVLGGAIDLHARVCRAIITDALTGTAQDPEDIDHPRTIQLLAAATVHRPILLVPEGCAEEPDVCDHRPPALPADDDWSCDFPDAHAACGACSLVAGSWAGEWEGQIDISVDAPCSVLRALAARFDVPIEDPQTEAAKENR
jgi:hypothetical protein